LHEGPREGALGRPNPRVGIARIALALFALFATLVPDVRALPMRAQAGGLFELTTSEPAPERDASALSFVLGYVGELEEDLEGDGTRLLTSTDDLGGYAGSPGSDIGWVLAARRPSAHEPTGPPSA
jgi:hypothetical protein